MDQNLENFQQDLRMVRPCDIIIERETRQRTKIDTRDLEESIRLRGILVPLILRPNLVLVAGERRLTAAINLAIPIVPCRLTTDLAPLELKLIELEENFRREDLPWRDMCRSLQEIHHIYRSMKEDWSVDDTAGSIGIDNTWLYRVLRVARDLDSPLIAQSGGIQQAYTTLNRFDERRKDEALNTMVEAITRGPEPSPTPPDVVTPELIATEAAPAVLAPSGVQPRSPLILTSLPLQTRAPSSILNSSFLEWASTYSGPQFNFIHCDFPYGVEAFKGGPNAQHSWDGYSDSEDDFSSLFDCLCSNWDRLMSPKSQLMFWLPSDLWRQHKILSDFGRKAPQLAFCPVPLVWHKTDNLGMVPDKNRRPKHVYESAFIASTEDRFIAKLVSDAYGAPTDKTIHPSCKPEPVLRHFFQLFVDEGTRMLDPTCGSGSSLRAAETLGAKTVLGLESNHEFWLAADAALEKSRIKRRANEALARNSNHA